MTNEPHTDEIRRLANGAIDTNYYVAHCHHMRSLAAHRAIRRAITAMLSLLGRERKSEGTMDQLRHSTGDPVADRPAQTDERETYSEAA